MKQYLKKSDFPLFIFVSLLVIVYIGIFTYLNLYKYTQHVDSDIAAEALLAREIWLTKDFTPSNWISSTERRIISVPMIASLFYGLSSSMVFSMGISCTIISIILLAALAYTLKKCHLSPLGIATALLVLCALPSGGLRNEDQMVPFVTLLLFLFADYYALHSILLLLSIAFAIHLMQKSTQCTLLSLKDFLGWGFLLCLCGGLALGGMRCLQVITLPLALKALLQFFPAPDSAAKARPFRPTYTNYFVLSILGVSLLAKLYPTNVDYPMHLQNAGNMVDRFTRQIPASILECLGIQGDCYLISLDALYQLGMFALLALAIYGIFFIFHPKFQVCYEQKFLVSALLFSFLLTVFIITVTTAENAHNYFFVIWFVLVVVVGILITRLKNNAPILQKSIVLCICIMAILNIKYTYAECITTTDNLQEYEEVITYMEHEDISYGYAEFWDASRISLMTDGKITMGHSYQIEELSMYWWLTNTNWYVPHLPEDMRTAYVVKSADKEAFVAQFEDPSLMQLGYENNRFAVYISEKNMVSR